MKIGLFTVALISLAFSPHDVFAADTPTSSDLYSKWNWIWSYTDMIPRDMMSLFALGQAPRV